MRETLLHLKRVLTAAERERLCAALGGVGASCRTSARSGKEQLLFVAYDETRSVPVDLVRLAAQSGCTAQIVDL